MPHSPFSVVNCMVEVGCRCRLQQRLLLQRWRVSGTHWWREPSRRTESLIITLGGVPQPCNDQRVHLASIMVVNIAVY